MRHARWLKPNPDGEPNPELAIYHVVSRVVDRRFVLGTDQKEHFRMLMRMYERFTGCRVLSYCFMTNHFHLLLEVPEGCGKGETLELSDEELLRRLGGLYSKAYVKGVEREIAEARLLISGRYDGAERLDKAGLAKNANLGERQLKEIQARYSYRMHSLSEFMKRLKRLKGQTNKRKNRLPEDWSLS